MRSLVVFYSLTGNTRKLAEQAAQALSADLAEVRAPRYRPGFFGFLCAGLDTLRGRPAEIEVVGPAPDAFDFVLVMGPVWSGQAAGPVRAYLARHAGKLGRCAFVLTCNAACHPQALEQMAEVARAAPEASLVLKAQEFRGRTYLPPPFAALIAAIRPREAARAS